MGHQDAAQRPGGEEREHTRHQSTQIGGRWTRPAPVVINGIKGTCPVLSPDGRRLYFCTWDDKGGRICYVERTGTGWSATHYLPDVINSTPKIHWNASVDQKGNLYFAHGSTISDVKILYSEFRNGEYSRPEVIENLKDAATICPYVAPDGSYLIYVKGIEAARGGSNKALFMMFRNKAGRWGKEINITDIVGGQGFCPTVSADGRYLFFFDRDVMYWADASFIKELKARQAE